MKKIHLNHFRLYLHGKGHKLDPNSYCLSYQVKHEANLRDPQNELWHAEFKLLGYPRKLKINSKKYKINMHTYTQAFRVFYSLMYVYVCYVYVYLTGKITQ